jgi:hypothetical protein
LTVRALRWLTVSLALVQATGAGAGEMGHYVAGSWSPRDLLAAPPGLFAAAGYAAFYSADRARTGDGVVIDGDDGLYVGADSWMVTPVIVYAPRQKVLGADWSITLVPAYGEAGANARLTAFGEAVTLFDNNRTALGDTYLVPATLTWALNPTLSLSAQYAVWVPTGSYDADRADNVGLGYWSHDFRGTVSWFPLGNPGILLSASVVHEINGSKEGFDIDPAPHTSLELGFSMATSERFMFGLMLNGLWETGVSDGSQAAEDGRDRLYSFGGEATYWFRPGKLGGTVRYTNEFDVRDRFEGDTLVAGVNVIF